MPKPPECEIPIRTMPQTHKKPSNEQCNGNAYRVPRSNKLNINAALRMAVFPRSAKWQVEIISDPRRECDMPTAPEFPRGCRKIGPIEIIRKTNAQKSC